LKCCDIYAPYVAVVGERVTVRYVFTFDNDIDLGTFSSYEATKYEGNKSNEKWTKSYDDRKHTWTITYTFIQGDSTGYNTIYAEYPRSTHKRVAEERIQVVEAEGKCGDNAFWYYENNHLSIFGSGDIYDYDDNNPAPWDNKKSEIWNIFIDDGITRIGNNAFSHCTNQALSQIHIPSTVTSIGHDSFLDCTGLQSIRIHVKNPDDLTIEDNADDFIRDPDKRIKCHVIYTARDGYKSKFGNSMIIVGDEYGICGKDARWSFDENTGTLEINFSGRMYDYSYSQDGSIDTPWDGFKAKIKHLEIDDIITYIGNNAFRGLKNITSVTISNSVNEIGLCAFKDCFELETVNFQDGSELKAIRMYSFDGCLALKEITLPEGLKNIDVCALANLRSAQKITLPSSVTKIDKRAFAGTRNVIHEVYISANPSKLEWATDPEELKPNKATICHVPLKYFNGYMERFSQLNLTFIADCEVAVSKDIENGNILVSKNLANKGDEITLTAVPSTGYKLKSLTVTDSSGNPLTVTDNKFTMPESDVTVSATFEKQKYTIKFVNDDGTPLQSSSVAYGEMPEYKSDEPTKAKTAEYSYKFDKWSPEIEKVTGEKTYTATYTNSKNKYTVKFVDDDGKTLLQSSQVEYGETPKYTEANPTKKSTELFEYTFKGWNKKITAVTGNVTYKAVYDSKRINLETTRLAGKNRFLTAVEISKAGFETADTAVLAYGMNYADALAGVPLASKLNAPILLTYTDTLDSATLEELGRLKAKKVIILGGTGAINEDVEVEIKRNGLENERIAGTTRFGTATAVAEKLSEEPQEVFFVFGNGFADALSVSAVAAQKNAPIIYLTTNGDLHADTAAYLAKLKEKGSVQKAYFIGGTGVISDDMMKKAYTALGLEETATQRIAGNNRFLTCVEINKAFADVLTGKTVCVATGANFPDALAGGVLAAQKKASLFLATGKLSDEQIAYLKAKAAESLCVFGGVGAVPDELVKSIVQSSI